MDFGKLPNIDRVTFRLPKEDSRLDSVLTAVRPPRLQVKMGAPIWTKSRGLAPLYPRGTPASDYLHAYAQQFTAIELNPTFYRIPNREQVSRWRDTVPADFRFAPKLHQSISHFEDFATAKQNLRIFWDSVSVLRDHLGLCFLQLPPHFDFGGFNLLKTLLREFPVPQGLAVEFRHPTWFDRHQLRAEAYELLSSLGVATVITDVAGRRDVLHTTLTARKVLIRFIGNELHSTDYDRIDDWVERLAGWIEKGIEEIYFFIHQPEENGVIELAQIWVEKMNARCDLQLRNIELPTASNSAQLSLF